MSARIYSQFAERKLPGSPSAPKSKEGHAGGVKVKTAAWPGLPGKASNWYKVRGGKVVKQHPHDEGLC